jgi:signal transduction histidine kinase
MIVNLVRNAAEASSMNAGSRVALRLRRETVCDPATVVVDVGILHRGNYAVVEVEDEGVGMSP